MNEELMEFPTRFPIKAMGRNASDFRDHVVQLVSAQLDEAPIHEVTERTSSGDQFLSITVEITATSRAQLDAIYTALSGDERILMAL